MHQGPEWSLYSVQADLGYDLVPLRNRHTFLEVFDGSPEGDAVVRASSEPLKNIRSSDSAQSLCSSPAVLAERLVDRGSSPARQPRAVGALVPQWDQNAHVFSADTPEDDPSEQQAPHRMIQWRPSGQVASCDTDNESSHDEYSDSLDSSLLPSVDSGWSSGSSAYQSESLFGSSRQDMEEHDGYSDSADTSALRNSRQRKSKLRPCKGKRARYRKLVSRLMDQYRSDPTRFDIRKVDLPPSFAQSPQLVQKLEAKIHSQLNEERAMCDSTVEAVRQHQQMDSISVSSSSSAAPHRDAVGKGAVMRGQQPLDTVNSMIAGKGRGPPGVHSMLPARDPRGQEVEQFHAALQLSNLPPSGNLTPSGPTSVEELGAGTRSRRRGDFTRGGASSVSGTLGVRNPRSEAMHGAFLQQHSQSSSSDLPSSPACPPASSSGPSRGLMAQGAMPSQAWTSLMGAEGSAQDVGAESRSEALRGRTLGASSSSFSRNAPSGQPWGYQHNRDRGIANVSQPVAPEQVGHASPAWTAPGGANHGVHMDNYGSAAFWTETQHDAVGRMPPGTVRRGRGAPNRQTGQHPFPKVSPR